MLKVLLQIEIGLTSPSPLSVDDDVPCYLNHPTSLALS
jgi:hypothetical protein